MSITLEIPEHVEDEISEAAARRGSSVQDYALAAVIRAARRDAVLPERNRRVVALMDEWLSAPIDEEEAEGYPETITPLSLREMQID